MKKRKINWLVAIIVIVASLFGVNQRQIGQYVSQYNSHETSLPTKQTTVQNVADKNLSQLTFKSGSASYLEVNHKKVLWQFLAGNKTRLIMVIWII